MKKVYEEPEMEMQEQVEIFIYSSGGQEVDW